MKKRKLLFGVLLASAAFSLAACTAKENKTSTKDAEKTSETTPVESTPVESTPAESATTTEGNTPEVVEKVLVSFYQVIGTKSTELEDLATEINKGSKITLPAEEKLKKDGYKIIGYYTSKGCQTAFNFDKAIDDDCDVYIKYEEKGDYDTYAESQNKVCAFDFNNTTIKYRDVKFNATTPEAAAAAEADAKIVGGEVNLTKNSFIVDPAKKMETGLIQMYFEVTFEGVKTKEAFIQINGTSSKKSDAEVIGIRVDGTSKFAYRLDQDATDITIGTDTVKTATKYKFLVEIDTAEGLLDISVNGSKLLEKATIAVDSVNGLKFTAKSDGSSAKVIDNVAILFTAKTANPVVAARKALLNDITAYVTEVNAGTLDDVIKSMVSNKADEYKASAAAASTTEALTELQTQWTTFKNTNKYLVTVTPLLADGTPVTELKPFKLAVLDGQTPNLDVVEYSLYDTDGIYIDNTLTTAYTPGEAEKNQELYVKVAKCEFKGSYKFEASSLTATADNEAFIAGSYLIGTDRFFKLVSNGTAVKRYKDDAVYAIELEKKFSNYIEFTTAGPCTIVMHAGSTGKDNTTAGFGVYTDNQGKNLATGVTAQSVTGTDTELTFNISAAGTYYIGYTESGRSGRILSVEVQYQAS